VNGMGDSNINKKQQKSEKKDVPVSIGGEKVTTEPSLVRTIELGEKDKKITDMVKKRNIQK
jgi:hypothetical protein